MVNMFGRGFDPRQLHFIKIYLFQFRLSYLKPYKVALI